MKANGFSITLDHGNDLPKLFTDEGVSDQLGISQMTLWRARRRGRLSYRRIGGRIYYTLQDIEEYLERQKQPAVDIAHAA